jgi:hypothetical protein
MRHDACGGWSAINAATVGKLSRKLAPVYPEPLSARTAATALTQSWLGTVQTSTTTRERNVCAEGVDSSQCDSSFSGVDQTTRTVSA